MRDQTPAESPDLRLLNPAERASSAWVVPIPALNASAETVSSAITSRTQHHGWAHHVP